MRSIIIFTQFYPYTDYDYYFEEEIGLIAGKFDRVILVSSSDDTSRMRNVSANTSVLSFSFTKKVSRFPALKFIFSKGFFSELKNAWRSGVTLNASLLSHILMSLYWSQLYQKLIFGIIKKNSFDPNELTIYSHWMLDHADAAGKIKKIFPKMRVIARAHSFEIYRHRSNIDYIPLRQSTFENIDHLVFISQFGKEYFKQHYWVTAASECKLSVHHLGIITAEWSQSDFQNHERLQIVSNAFISSIKRIHLIAEALSLLPEYLKTDWVHFGSVYRNATAFDDFKNQVALGLKRSPHIGVKFFGTVPNQLIRKFYAENFIDLIINVSQTEGIPVSLMETCSFGVPAIATSTGGNPEIIKDEINGILIPENCTAKEIAAAMLRYVNFSNDLKQNLRDGAQKMWAEKFNAAINYDRFVKEIIFEDVTNSE
jgi:glycosyltransferase involved in cell wall biosynthesis